MTTQESVLGLIDPGRVIRRPPVIGMAFLHEAPVRPNDLVRSRPRSKTERLIGLLLGHFAPVAPGVRALPRVKITLNCRAPSGKTAIELGF